MTPDRVTPAGPRLAAREVALVAAALAGILLAMAPFYGPHRDELYFASAGDRPAWGYPDQPSFVPMVAWLAHSVAPGSLVVMRLPSIVAVVGLVWLAAHLARRLGGERAAQVLTAAVVAGSAVIMTVGHRLSTATFDILAWTAVLVLVSHALAAPGPRWWLAAGVVAGLGLHNKHAVVFLLVGVFVALAVDRRVRPALRTRWPWLAALLALVIWLPNLGWQATHDWPVRALSADIAEEYGGVGGRVGLIVEAALMFSPLVTVVVVIGIVSLLRDPGWADHRFLAITFLAVTAVFLVIGGKGYYLAGLMPPLIAAGCVRIAAGRSTRRVIATGAVLVASAVVAWPALVPVLPAATYADSFYPALGGDQVETIGWPGYAAQVRGVVASIPAGERASAVVFTGNYGEAGAFEWYGVGAPVYSGHNGWRNWGPPPDGSGPVVVVGVRSPELLFTGCREATTLRNDVGIENEELGMVVWLCDGLVGSWSERWPDLGHYDA